MNLPIRQIGSLAKRIFRVLQGREHLWLAEIDLHKETLGNSGANWCIAPDLLNEASVVYSFGVGHDVSFDLELIAKFGLTVHAFDPSPRCLEWVKQQSLPSRFVLHEVGIGKIDGVQLFQAPAMASSVSFSMMRDGHFKTQGIELPLSRLSTIMESLNHDHVDLLKLDIEGSEYEVIEDLLLSKLKVKQLLVEFHHSQRLGDLRETNEAVLKLKGAGYRIFNVSITGAEISFCREGAPGIQT